MAGGVSIGGRGVLDSWPPGLELPLLRVDWVAGMLPNLKGSKCGGYGFCTQNLKPKRVPFWFLGRQSRGDLLGREGFCLALRTGSSVHRDL